VTRLAESPEVVAPVAAMPDVHLGRGATVGSVFASRSAVCPAAVGADIGCGMIAVPMTRLLARDLPPAALHRLHAAITARVPVGKAAHASPPPGSQRALEELLAAHPPSVWLSSQLARGGSERVARSLGTLGGGNHFIEVLRRVPPSTGALPAVAAAAAGAQGVAEDEGGGRVWLMLHSGSRGVGRDTAQHWDSAARSRALAARRAGGRQGAAPSAGAAAAARPGGMHWLPVASAEGQGYLRDMHWCLGFAAANRRAMMGEVAAAVEAATGDVPDWGSCINIHHNYCSCERVALPATAAGAAPEEEELWVTRKGATSARVGELGIIPGSMGTGSYITVGKGNPAALASCAHGAGRRLPRAQAAASLSPAAFAAAMEGIVWDAGAARALLDEAPEAYKDLGAVMANQASLLQVQHRLLPLLNIKGHS
jgi:tRNA-splicing ligase RtcB